MNSLKLNLTQHWPKYLIVLIVSLFFLQSVKQRAPYFGKYTSGDHNWLTAHSVLFLREWMDEGAINKRLIANWQPLSVESDVDRYLYVSYPPGNLLPLFVFCKITGQYPSKDIVMAYNLLNHFLIAIVLALIAYTLIGIINIHSGLRILMSLAPSLFYLFSPAIMYWHQNVFFTDQGVLLPFILLVMLEAIRPKFENKYFYMFVVFWGCSVDYLMYVLLFSVFVWRYIAKENRSNMLKGNYDILFPSVLLGILFAFQLWLVGGFGTLFTKFLGRIGATPLVGESWAHFSLGTMWTCFWNLHIKTQYGDNWIVFLVVSAGLTLFLLYAFLIKKKIELRGMATTSFLLFFTCLLQVYVLNNHSQVHAFSAQKFGLVFGIIPFVIFPATIIYYLKTTEKQFRWVTYLICLVSISVCSSHVFNENKRRDQFFGTRVVDKSAGEQDDEFRMQIAESIRPVLKYDYILFSPNLNISFIPTCVVAESMKQCYSLSQINDFKSLLVEDKAKLCLLFTFDNLPNERYFDFLTKKSLKIWENKQFKMFCIKGTEVDNVIEAHKLFVSEELMRLSTEESDVLRLVSFYQNNKDFVPKDFDFNKSCQLLVLKAGMKLIPYNESVNLVAYELAKTGEGPDSLYTLKMCIQVAKRIPDSQKIDWLLKFMSPDKNDYSLLGFSSKDIGYSIHSLNPAINVGEEGFYYAEKNILLPNIPLHIETHLWETVSQQPFGDLIYLNPHQFPMKYKLKL